MSHSAWRRVHGPRAQEQGLQTVDCRQWTVDYRLSAIDHGLIKAATEDEMSEEVPRPPDEATEKHLISES